MDRLFETGYPAVAVIEAAAAQRLKRDPKQSSLDVATIRPNGVESAGQPQGKDPGEGSCLRKSHTFLLGLKDPNTPNR